MDGGLFYGHVGIVYGCDGGSDSATVTVAIAVADRISEAITAVEIYCWRINDLPLHNRRAAIGGRADRADSQGISGYITIIGQDIDGDGCVFGSGGAIILRAGCNIVDRD